MSNKEKNISFFWKIKIFLKKRTPRERFLLIIMLYSFIILWFVIYNKFITTPPSVDMEKIEKQYEKQIHISELQDFIKEKEVISIVQPEMSFTNYFELVVLNEDKSWLDTYKVFKTVNEEWSDFNGIINTIEFDSFEWIWLSVPKSNIWLELFKSILPLFLLLWFLIYLSRWMWSSKSTIETFDATMENKVTFENIGWIESQKEEILSFIDTIKNIKKFNDRWVRTPRWILLAWPPWVWKTMIAKAIAWTVWIDLFVAKWTDFKSKWYWEWAKNVDKAFKKIMKFLNKNKRNVAILFIDEIENLLRERWGQSHWADDDIVNTFLDKIDGISGHTNVILIGATNHLDKIDSAARSRFDIEISFWMPNLNERLDIIDKLIKARIKKDEKLKIKENLDYYVLASYTSWQSWRFIESIINQAHIDSVKNWNEIDEKLLMSIWEDKTLWKEKRWIHFNEKDADTVCIHELWHWIISHLENKRVIKLTNIPRGQALWICFSIPKEEKILSTETEILWEVRQMMAWRIAEEVFLDRITTWASNDFQKIENTLFNYLTRYNFKYNKKGLWHVIDPIMENNPIYLAKIREEISPIIKEIYEKEANKVRKFFKRKDIKELFWKMHKSLLEKRNLYEEDFISFLDNIEIDTNK